MLYYFVLDAPSLLYLGCICRRTSTGKYTRKKSNDISDSITLSNISFHRRWEGDANKWAVWRTDDESERAEINLSYSYWGFLFTRFITHSMKTNSKYLHEERSKWTLVSDINGKSEISFFLVFLT